MIFILGLVTGLAIGVNLGAYLMRKAIQPLIDDHKKSSDYWYNDSKTWRDAYFKELTEGYEKVNQYLKILNKPL